MATAPRATWPLRIVRARPRLFATGAIGLVVTLAGRTILLSWTFIHTIFALHHAHEFYDARTGRGMAFPGGDYRDFVYFSFVFNAALLALTVNLAASAM